MPSDQLGLFVLVVSCIGRLSGESSRIFFFLPNFFLSLFVPIAILLEFMRQEKMLFRKNPSTWAVPTHASVLFGIHRIDDPSLGCAVANQPGRPKPKPKHSKVLEF